MQGRFRFLPSLIVLILVSATLGWIVARSTLPASTSVAPSSVPQPLHRVAIVPPGLTSPFHVLSAQGAREQGEKLGWKVEVQAATSENDTEGQVILVQQLLEMGTEAVSISSLQPESLVPDVKAANAKNVPVFIHNSLTPLSDGNVAAYIGYDQWHGAVKLGEYTCGLLAKKFNTTPEKAIGKVFILLGIDGFHTHRRTQGYKSGLELCPGVKVVGQQTADWDREEGATVATAALQQTPDIDVFFGNSDEMGIGAALAAEKLGMKINKDFFVVSIDGNSPTLDLIKSGKYTATLGVYPSHMGETIIDTMGKVLSGKEVPQFIMTPSTMVDATNVDDYVSGKTWTTPVAGAPEFDNGLPSGIQDVRDSLLMPAQTAIAIPSPTR